MTADRLPSLLLQMSQAVNDALSYVDGMTREEFLEDRRTEQAVVMNLVILGEIAVRIMENHPDFSASHPEIPWRNMRGMRNRIAHGYFEMDMDIVWETVQRSLPNLQRLLATLDP